MLNEVYDLWQACERAGIDLPIRIPGLDEGQSADGIRLFLGESGAVMRVESVSAQQMKRIRKWSCGSGITLPVFNFEPLHQLEEEEYRAAKEAVNKLAKGRAADLTPFLHVSGSVAAPLAVRWSGSKTAMLDSAFKKVSADLLEKIAQDEAVEGDGWRKLLQTVQKLNAKGWLDRLSLAIRQIARDHCFPALLNLVFHNSAKVKARTVPVQFEADGVSTPVYSERAQNWLIGVLARSVVPASAEESERSEIDSAAEGAAQSRAVWGVSPGSSQKYGQVKLARARQRPFIRSQCLGKANFHSL